MTTIKPFDRITVDPNIMAGRPCIRGMRIQVSLILNLIANGMTTEDIIMAYPYIEPEDISQCLHYAAWLAEDRCDMAIHRFSDALEKGAILSVNDKKIRCHLLPVK
jgi:uncharacterized protein (DUF433 family)